MINRCKNSMTQPIRAAVAPSNRNISPYEKPSIAHCLFEEKSNSFETLKSSIKGQNGNYSRIAN